MKFKKQEVIILKDLFDASNGLMPYSFYQRYRYSPATVFSIIEKFVKKQIIFIKGNRIFLSKKGKSIFEKGQLTGKTYGSKFDNIPSKFIAEKMEINEFYLPRLSYLSKEFQFE